MGWYPSNKKDVIWGDDAFMDIHRFLDELTESYKEGVGRLPTVEEFESTLAQAIRSRGEEETFSNVSGKGVSAITLKLVKRKAKQPVKIGDIFACEIAPKKYAFAKIVSIKDGWDLAEVLSKTSNKPLITPEIANSPVLYPPFTFHLRDITDWKIKIIGESASTNPPAHIAQLEFVSGFENHWWTSRVGGYKKLRDISNEEAKTLPQYKLYATERMIKEMKIILDNNVTVEAWLKTLKK